MKKSLLFTKDMLTTYFAYLKTKTHALIFTTSKIKDSFSTKDRLSSFSQSSKVIYKFVCASCSASYIGEKERHLSVRIKEHFKDKNSHMFKRLNASLDCKRACTDDCFSILDRASTKFQLRIKESLHIKGEQVLNKQLYSYTSTLIL